MRIGKLFGRNFRCMCKAMPEQYMHCKFRADRCKFRANLGTVLPTASFRPIGESTALPPLREIFHSSLTLANSIWELSLIIFPPFWYLHRRKKQFSTRASVQLIKQRYSDCKVALVMAMAEGKCFIAGYLLPRNIVVVESVRKWASYHDRHLLECATSSLEM